MKLIPVKAISESFNIKNNTLTYETDTVAAPGVLLQSDSDGEKDMIIVNQIHNGGSVTVKMKPFRMPAKKYNVGDVVAILMLQE